VVLELGSSDTASRREYDLSALDWAAEHARELGARPGALVVAGDRAGAARAARLAVHARDGGWPVLRRQVLVLPAFTEARLTPSHVAGTAPATIVTTGARGDDGSRYAATLRDAGVEVQELVSNARRALPLPELARALR
jgi:carboxylesterase type B